MRIKKEDRQLIKDLNVKSIDEGTMEFRSKNSLSGIAIDFKHPEDLVQKLGKDNWHGVDIYIDPINVTLENGTKVILYLEDKEYTIVTDNIKEKEYSRLADIFKKYKFSEAEIL